MKAQESNKQLFHLRLNWTLGLVVVLFLVLASRLWQLQVIQGPEYVRLAEQNRVRTIQLVAPRGTISDRNNVPLVENRSAFNILLYRESIKDMEATTQYVVEKLGVKPEDLAVKMRRGKVAGLYRPVVIKEDVSIDDISVVEAHKRQHPEIQLGPEPRRHYRHGSLAAHVLGYVGEVSEDEILREAFPGTAPGDLVGKSGVERVYNQNLTGTDGKREVLVTSVGREVGFLDEMEAQVGGELQLTPSPKPLHTEQLSSRLHFQTLHGGRRVGGGDDLRIDSCLLLGFGRLLQPSLPLSQKRRPRNGGPGAEHHQVMQYLFL